MLLIAASTPANANVTAATVTKVGIGSGGASYITQSSSAMHVFSVQLTNDSSADDFISISVNLADGGTPIYTNQLACLSATDTSSGIALYLDSNSDQALDGGDVFVQLSSVAWTSSSSPSCGDGTNTADSAMLSIAAASQALTTSATTYYLVVIRTNSDLPDAKTFTIGVPANGIATTNGGSFPAALQNTDVITSDISVPTYGTVTPSDVASATYVDGSFTLTTSFSDTGSGVASCEYCSTTDGDCTGDWAASTYAAGDCTQTAITCTDSQSLTLNMRAYDAAGNIAEAVAVTRTCDTTAPSAPATVNDGTGADVSIATSTTSISANWALSSDTGSGVQKYWYSVGTTAGASNVVSWTDNGTATGTSVAGTYAHGSTYYFNVTTEDNVSLFSGVTSSNGQIIDAQTPDQGLWNPATGSYATSTAVTVYFTTNETADCKWSLTNQGYAAMTDDCTGDGTTSQTCPVTGLPDGATDTVYISCQDSNGNQDAGNVSGTYKVDTTAPSAPATVSDGTGSDISVSTSTTSISANWSPSTDAESGVQRYWYSIGTTAGASDVVSWTDNGTATGTSVAGTYAHGSTYYFNVTTENNAGLMSGITSSNGQTIDAQTPNQGLWNPATGSYATATAVTVYFTTSETADCKWSLTNQGYAAMTDDCTGDGTTSQTCPVTGLPDGATDTVYISCQDSNGNQDAGNVSGTYKVDTTAPSAPATVSDGTGADISVSTSTTSISANWALSTDTGSGIQKYWYSVGTTAGASDVASWTDNGTATGTSVAGTYAHGSIYYFNVTAENNAGLMSGITSSNGQTIDVQTPDQGLWNPATGSYATATAVTVYFTTSETADCKWSLTNQGYAAMTGDCTGDGTTSQTCPVTGLPDGATDTVYISCQDSYGNQDAGNVSGTYKVDTTAPSAPATVSDGTGSDISVSTSTTSISANWSLSTDTGSGVQRYWYSVGTTAGASDVVSWTDNGTATGTSVAGTYTHGTTYYFNVTTENNAGLMSGITSSNGQTVDVQSPNQGLWNPATGSYATSTAVTVYITTSETADCKWSLTNQGYAAMTDDCTGDGTTSQTCPVTGLPDGATDTVYISCQDSYGNQDAGNVSGTYKVDTTAPSAPATVSDGTGADVSISTSTTSISANWALSTDAESGVQRYWYSVGTTAGASDVVSWTDNGTATGTSVAGTYTHGSIYYFNVTTENNAGLMSGITSSNGQTIDAQTPNQSLWNPATGSFATSTAVTVYFTTSETADCKWSLTNLGYAAMTDDCTGDGTTSQTCPVTGLPAGATDTVYIACQDSYGNQDSGNVSGTYKVDNTAPNITALESIDLDHNGILEAVHIVFDENILDASVSASNFDVQNVTDETFNAIYNSDTADDNDIYITFTTGSMNTGALPTVQYSPGVITDVAGNLLSATGPTPVADKAAPIMAGAALGDGDGVITVSFSENVTSTGITASDVYASTTVAKFGYYVPAIVQASNSSTMTFTIVFANPNTTAKKFLPTDIFNFSGSEAKVVDAAGLSLYTNSGQPTVNVAADTTPPDFASVIQPAGTSKSVLINFTEPVVMSTVAMGDFVITDTTGTRANASMTYSDANSIYISVSGANLSPPTNIEMKSPNTNTIDDLAGNQLSIDNDTPQLVSDLTPPSISSASTYDLDSDGYIDAVKITFDEYIKDTSVTASNFNVASATVANEAFSSTTNGDVANDQYIYITFDDGILTTAATPTVSYIKGTLTDMTNNYLPDLSPKFATDTAKPVVQSVSTMDSNADGTIDMMKVTLSEPVQDTTFGGTGWAVSDTTAVNATLQNPTGDVVNDSIIYIGITASATLDTDILTQVYDTTVAGGALKDFASATLAACNIVNDCNSACVTETDGAPPVFLSNFISDTEPNGYLDSATWRFTEALTGTPQIADWTLTDADTSTNLLSALADGNVSISGATITITLSNSLGTTGAPTFAYTQQGGDNVSDAAGNLLAAKTSTAMTDTAAPVFMAATSSAQIAGGDLATGTVLTLGFSENVVVTGANVAAGDFSVSGGSWHGGAAVTYADGAGNNMTATLGGQTTTKDWAGTPTINRSAGALTTANSIEDAAGNDAVRNASVTPSINGITDTTAPTITGVLTLDDDRDGQLDMLRVTFSENVDDSTFSTASWGITGGLSFTGSLASPVNSTDIADDPVIYVGLIESGYDTGVIPDLTIAAGATLADLGAGNVVPLTTSGAVTEADGASPVMYAASTIDSNLDGAIDMIKVTLSENITDAGFDKTKWTIGNTSAINATLQNPAGDVTDDNTIYIGITPSVTNDTDLVTEVYDTTVTTGALKDAANNYIIDCNSGCVTETDGAAPVFLGANTFDSNANGYLDSISMRFSESLTGAPQIADWALIDDDGATNLLSGLADGNVTISGATVTIALADNTGTTGIASYSYQLAGGDNLRDAALNETPAKSSTAATDAAKPVIRAVRILDDNLDGTMDMAKVTFSEKVADATFSNSGWAISDTSAVSGTLAVPTSETDIANDSIIYIGFTASTTGDTDIITQTYDTTSTSVALSDPSSNTVADCDTACVAETDGAAPAILSTSIADTEPDGYLNSVSLKFSEAVTFTPQIADWTLVDADTSTNLLSGLADVNVSISGATVTIALANNTGTTGAPTYTYTQAGGDNISDAAGNITPNKTSTAMSDTAAPVLMSVSSDAQIAGGDLATGTVFTIAFSENVIVTGANVAAADFTVVGGSWHGGATVNYADGATNTMTATLASRTTTKDWTNTPTFNRSAVALATSNSIEDSAGNDAVRNASGSPSIGGITDVTAPSVTGVLTLDDDRDGQLDMLRVTFNENVDDSSFTTTGWAITGGLSFTGSLSTPVNSIDSADDPVIYVGITESGYNTGVIPDLTTDGTATLTDLGAGNIMTVTASGAVTEADGASPVMHSASTMDSNNDGTIDMMKVTLSENVTDAGFDKTKWTIGNTSAINAALQNPAGDTADDNIIYIGITPSVTNDTDLVTEVYDTTVTTGTLKDAANNYIVNCNSACVSETDGAPPVIIGTSNADSNGNGYLDSVSLLFSEALTGSGQIGDWTLLDADGSTNLLSGITDGDVTISGATVTIALADNTGTTGAATYTYTQAGGDNIRDAVGNMTLNKSAAAITDIAKPVIRAVKILDDNHNGTMDIARVTFSEKVTDSSFSNTGWAISNTSAISGSLATPVTESDTANDNVIYIGFTASTAGDTDLVTQTYDTTSTSGVLRDLATNTVADCDGACVTETDGASPVVKAVSTMDDNADGTIDAMKVTLTEAVTDSDFNAANWSVSDTSAVQGLKAVTSVADVANDNVLYIGIAATKISDTDLSGEVYDTTVTAGTLKDAANNFIIDCNSACVVETDGAAPDIRYAETAAGNSTVTLIFTEPVYNAAGAPAAPGGNLANADIIYTDVSPTGRTISSFTATAGSATGTLVLSTVLNYSNDVNVDYVSPAAASIYDAAGNPANTAASAVFADNTPPGIVAAYEHDTDGDGNIDEVAIMFSEYINDTTVSTADAARFTVAGFNAVTVDSITNGAGTAKLNTTDPGVANDNYITIFTNDTSTTGTEAKAVAFTTAAGVFRDFGGNDMPSNPTVTVVDRAAPAYATSSMLDLDANGKVDAVQVVFSENIQVPASDTWTIVNAPSGGSKSSIFRSSADTIQIDITEGAGAADTAVGSLQFSYNNVSASIKDLDNNLTPSIPMTTPADGSKPVIIAARTGEATGTENGFVDSFHLTYSEPVTVASGDATLDIGNLPSNTLTVETYVSGGGTSELLFSVFNPQNTGAYDTAELPSGISYTHGTGTIHIVDISANANEAADQSFSGTVDGARPVIVAARTAEATASVDGFVDMIKLTYSEAVTIPAGSRSEFDVANLTSNTLLSETCNAGGCGSGTKYIEIQVTNSLNAGLYDTHELPANIVYTPAPGVVQDMSAAQNEAPSQTFLTVTDGAAPWLTSTVLTDTSTASEAYSDSLTVNVTTVGAAAVPSQVMYSQSSDFASNSSGWMAYAATNTYTLTAGDGSRTVYQKLRDAAGNESVVRDDSIVIDLTPPSVTVVKPNGAESVPARVGYTYTIQWTATDANMAASPISIYLDTDGSQTYPTLVASGLPNTGSYVWDTPQLDTLTARIKVVALDNAGNIANDVSNAVFTMDSTMPLVTMIAPLPNVEWRGGSSQVITWTVEDDHIDAPGPMSIHYSTDNWVSSTTVATGVSRGSLIATDKYQGSYTWNPVSSITTPVLLRVDAMDDSGKVGFNLTDLPIIIDSTPPNSGTVTIIDNSGWTNDNTPEIQIFTQDNGTESMQSSDTMRLACTEAALSSASYIAYATAVTDFNINTGPGCSAGDGTKFVWIEFKDVAGNVQSTHSSDSTNLETDATDVSANLKACTESSCTTQIIYPAYSSVPTPYFDWDQPATGPAPYQGYYVTLLPSTDSAPATCPVNATDTYKQFTSPEMQSLIAGSNGQMKLWVRALDMAGNCGPGVSFQINIDAFPPDLPELIIENYEYLDNTTATPTYWVKTGSTVNISVRYREQISLDRTYLAFNRLDADNMVLYHDWNGAAALYTETTSGAMYLSPLNGIESEGTGNGAAYPTPSVAGYFKYTWTIDPLGTNANYEITTSAIDMISNDSGWSSTTAYLAIDALKPVFAVNTVVSDSETVNVTANDQNVFSNDQTVTFNGTITDAQSGGYRVDLISSSGGNDTGASLPSIWTVAATDTVATWSFTTPAVSGHNELRFRGFDKVYNVTSADDGAIGNVDLFVDNMPPLAPTDAAATSTIPTQIQLTWTAPLDQGAGAGAVNGTTESFSEGQNWYRAGDVGVRVVRTDLLTSAQTVEQDWGAATTITNSGLQPDAQYQYDFFARDNNSEARGLWHNVSATQTITISTLANPVTILSLTSSYDPPPAQGGTGLGHIITVKADPNGNLAPTNFRFRMKSPSVQTANAATATYQFTGLSQNVTYCFTVAAVNTDGIQTTESAVVCGGTLNFNDTTPPLFGGVTSVTDPHIGSALDVAWTAGTDDSLPIEYRVYISATSGGQNFNGSAHITQGTSLRVTTLNDGTPLLNNIPYYIVVRAKDNSAAQNIEINTVQLSGVSTRDEVPPTIDLDPAGVGKAADGLITRNSSITLTGSTEIGASLSVFNQQTGMTFAGTVAGDGTFTGNASVSPGTNVLIVTATDGAGNQASDTVTVYNDVIPPTAAISSPTSGLSVSGNAVVISGSANDTTSFAYYVLSYGPGAAPSAWRGFATVSSSVSSAILGTWDTTGKSGSYTIRLSAYDSAGNETIASVLVNVSNTTTVTGTIPAGAWTMVGIPGAPLSSNPTAILGNGNYAIRRWNPAKTTDDPILLKYDTEFSVDTGNGFWVRAFGSGINYSMTIEIEDTTGAKTVHLNNGWNQIGVPFNRAMLWGDVRVTNTSTNQTVSMAQAAASGWIVGGAAYGYADNAYIMKGTADRLDAAVGYFVKCGDSNTLPGGCDLVFDPGSEQQNGIARIIRPPAYDLKLQVAAKTESSRDEENYIGVLSVADDSYDAYDSPEPPTIDPFVSVYFPRDDWQQRAGRYAGDVRPPFEGERTWEFVVDSDVQAGEKVAVYFPNADRISEDFDVSVKDVLTGASVNVSAGEYQYTSDGTPRHFEVTVRSGSAVRPETTLTYTLKQGWNLVTFPLDPRQTDAVTQLSDDLPVLDAFQFYENEYYSPDSAQRIDIQAGVAYWIHADAETPVDVSGKTISSAVELSLPLSKGWNLIGDPYVDAIAWGANIRLEYGGKSYTLEEAAAGGVLASGLFKYDEARQEFVPDTSAQLEPWRGYMLKAAVNCTLVFSAR